MSEKVAEIYEKIANLMAAGVPDVQIADAVGLSAGRISQLKNEEDFIRVFREKLETVAAEREELNQGWDEVEKKSLKIVSDALKYNKNPDFALRAAMVANRATRRGGGHSAVLQNEPLPGSIGAGRVVIQLNTTFIRKLQNLQVAKEGVEQASPALVHNITEATKKKVNMLAPGQVKTLLSDVIENDTVISGGDLGDITLVG